MDQQQCNNATLSVFYIWIFASLSLIDQIWWRMEGDGWDINFAPRQSIEGKFGRETRREERTLEGGDAQ